MDFDKQILKMSREKGSAFTQITLEEDYIIPDVKPDVLKVIHTKGFIVFDVPKVSNHSVWVNGRMDFTVLYRSEDTQWKVDAASGSIPFQEKLSMDDVEEADEVHLKGNFEDISASLINSRKIAIRAVVDIEAKAEDMHWEEIATGAEHDGDDTDAWEIKTSEKELLSFKFSQRDLLRIRKELTLGQGMPNILDLVYYDVAFNGLHTNINDRTVEVAGEASICVFYRGQNEDDIQLFQSVVPLEGTVDCKELAASDICRVDVEPEETEIEVREDYDGEQRVLAVDFAIGITVYAWEERKVPVLEDVYSTGCELAVKSQPVRCEHLLIYNQTKVRLAEQLTLEAGKERMLSIACASAKMVIEHTSRKDSGLFVEGMLTVHILYLSSDDFQPIGYAKGFLPVEQLIEIPQAGGTIRYELCPGVEQLAVGLMDSGTYEVKATVTLDALVFEEVSFDKITDIEEKPLDMDAIRQQPGLIGHKMRPQEDLWSIAKKYHTTVKNIMETNHLTDKNVNPGQKIVVVKDIL